MNNIIDMLRASGERRALWHAPNTLMLLPLRALDTLIIAADGLATIAMPPLSDAFFH